MILRLKTVLILTVVCLKSWKVRADDIVKVNKCCPLGQELNERTTKCQTSSSEAGNSTRWLLNRTFIIGNASMSFEWNFFGSPSCSKSTVKTVLRKYETLDNDTSAKFFFQKSGILWEIKYDAEFNEFTVNHLPHHYCIDPTHAGIVIQICQPTCDDNEPCIRKCCPVGSHYNQGTGSCEISKDDGYRLPLYSNPEHPSDKRIKSEPRFTSGLDFLEYSCNKSYQISTGWKFAPISRAVKVLVNGSLAYYHIKKNEWAYLENLNDYCYDRFYSSNKSKKLCRDEEDVVYFCQKEVKQANDSKVNASIPNVMKDEISHNSLDWLRTLGFILLVIAVICLFLTSVVLFFLIDRVNLHSWTRLSFVTSELIFLFLFSLLRVETFQQPKTLPCKTFAIAFHFTGLMTMCWLSIINFDLWWTFKVLKPTSNRKFDIRRFIYYTCFALGLPLLIVAIGLVIQYSRVPNQTEDALKDQFYCREKADERFASKHKQHPMSSLISPGYGVMSCSLTKNAIFPYWYGPLCFLLLANLVFFLFTSCRMASLQRLTRRASIESNKRQSQSNKIFMKIFIVSGVTWNIELIGWLFNVNHIYQLAIVHYLQAIALFIVFVCKKEVIRSLQQKYPIILKFTPAIGRSSRSATLASVSTDASSRIRVGRKLSTASSSNGVVGESYQRHESFEMPSSPTSRTAPVLV